MNKTQRTESYYDVLCIDASADSKTIRQAYLKQAVKYHPDKNPPEQADTVKERFIQIGHAYEILSDPTKRARYDRELRNSTRTPSSNPFASYFDNNNPNDTSRPSNVYNYDDQEQSYQSYRQAFDDHIANMSEAEVAAVVGVASVVGGLVGSIIGSKLGSNSTGQAGGSRGVASEVGSTLLASLGSMAGSMLASQAAAEVVRSIHQQSVERVAYQRQQNVEHDASGRAGYNNNSQDHPSDGINSNTANRGNAKPEISMTFDDVISAVDTGMKMWKSMSSKNK
jgi:curved DNA-binding protein CbpA